MKLKVFGLVLFSPFFIYSQQSNYELISDAVGKFIEDYKDCSNCPDYDGTILIHVLYPELLSKPISVKSHHVFRSEIFWDSSLFAISEYCDPAMISGRIADYMFKHDGADVLVYGEIKISQLTKTKIGVYKRRRKKLKKGFSPMHSPPVRIYQYINNDIVYTDINAIFPFYESASYRPTGVLNAPSDGKVENP